MIEKDSLFEAIVKGLAQGRQLARLDEDIWRQFGETCAVLVADSTHFTRATQVRGVTFFLAVIAKLRDVAAEVFSQNGALGFRAVADNVYAEFSHVDQAVASALALHKYFEDNPFILGPDDRYGVCIGIGYGQMLRSDREGRYGNEMNLASKLGEDIAARGETLLTESAYLNLRDQTGLAFEERQIKISEVTVPYYSLRPA